MPRLLLVLTAPAALLMALPLMVPASPASVAPDAKPVLYFPTTVGTKWVYDEDGQEWTEVITEAKGKDIIVTVGRVGAKGKVTPHQRVAVSAKGLALLERDGEKLDPPVTLLEPPPPPLPEIPGLSPDPLPLDGLWLAGKVVYTVTGPEQVEVPAGKYMAARVVPGRLPAEGGTLVLPLTETLWYAPAVGLVKRTLTSEGGKNTLSERVLKKFTPGRP